MAKFLKLTQKSGNHPLYVNIEFVSIIRVVGGDTLLFYENGEYFVVCETPEQILQMIADESPTPPVSSSDFPRMWRDGWYQGQYHGQMLTRQWPSDYGWGADAVEATSFDQVAASLRRPIQTCQPSDRDKPAYDEMMKQAQEPLDGPPDM